MRKLIFLLFIVGVIPPLPAQVWEWVQTAGSEREVNYGAAVSTDNQGNVYITGCHHAPLQLHQDVESRRWISLVNAITRDDRMFVAKYDRYGNLLWANYAAGKFVEGRDVIADRAGNVYVTGHFSNLTKFTSTDNNHRRLNGYAPGLMFLAKYDQRGTLKWVVKGGGVSGKNSGTALGIEGNRIYVAGYSELAKGESLLYHSSDYSKQHFHPFTLDGIERSSVGSLVIYNTEGKLVDARFIGGKKGHVYFHDLKIDLRGNYFLSGAYRGTFRIGSQIFQTQQEEGLVLAFDLDHSLVWNLGVETNFCVNSAPRLAIQANKLGLTFAFEGLAYLKDSHGKNRMVGRDKTGEQTLYIAQLNLQGFPNWQALTPVPLGGAGTHDLAFGPMGNLYLAGHYTGQIVVGDHQLNAAAAPIPATEEAQEAVVDKNLFIAKYTGKGRTDWALSSSGNRYEIAYGLAVDGKQQVYSTGYFHGNHQASFGRAPIREFGPSNIFLARIHPHKKDDELRYPVIPLPTDYNPITRPLLKRQLIHRQTITVKSSEIDLYLWDNRKIDGDVISLFLNDSCILRSYALSSATKHVKVRVAPHGGNMLILYAETTGSIGPNTTAVTVVDGYTRQRVHLQAGMDRSEALEIKCDPPRGSGPLVGPISQEQLAIPLPTPTGIPETVPPPPQGILPSHIRLKSSQKKGFWRRKQKK